MYEQVEARNVAVKEKKTKTTTAEKKYKKKISNRQNG